MLRWRFAVVALLLGFFAFTTPASADSKIPLSQQQARLFQRAGEHYKKNQFSRVRELLQTEAKDRENPHPYACILYGLSCLQEGKAAEASNIFFKGLAKHPKNFSLNNNLGISLMREGKYEAAAERFQFTTTLASEAGRNDILFSAAQCWYSARKYNKAATIAEKLVSLPSPRTEWVRLAAVANMGVKNWKKAEQFFQIIVQLQPKDREAWRALTQVRLRRNDYVGAAAALEAACRLPGATKADKAALANIYRAANAPLLSMDAGTRASELSQKESEVITNLARAGRYEGLLKYLNHKLKSKPTTALYLERGIALYRLRDLKAAQDSFRRGAELGMKDADRCRMLEGLLAWEHRDYQTAKASFGKIEESSRYHAQARQAISSLDTILKESLELQHIL